MADSRIDFIYLSEPDMIRAGVKDMKACIESMEDMLLLLKAGDYMMGGENHNSHGCMVMFPDDPKFPGMPKNAPDRRFMAMPAYLGGKYQMAGVKWYGSNIENKKIGLPRSILTMMLNDKDTGAPLALMSLGLSDRRNPGRRDKVHGAEGFRDSGDHRTRRDGKDELCSICGNLPEPPQGSHQRKGQALDRFLH